MNSRVWSEMVDITEKLLLDKIKPNSCLIEEVFSLDASKIGTISDEKLRQYLIALGQYLITLQCEENKVDAISSSWQKSLDAHIFRVLNMGAAIVPSKIKTVSEKRAWVLENDNDAKIIYTEYITADSKKKVLKNLTKPVEQFINTLKKEIDARESEKKRQY